MKDELASVREALEKLQGSGRSFASSMDPEAIANYERINTQPSPPTPNLIPRPHEHKSEAVPEQAMSRIENEHRRRD